MQSVVLIGASWPTRHLGRGWRCAFGAFRSAMRWSANAPPSQNYGDGFSRLAVDTPQYVIDDINSARPTRCLGHAKRRCKTLPCKAC